MNLEPVLEQIDPKESSAVLPFPKAWWVRALYGIFVMAAPAFSFSVIDALKPQWQDGDFSSYLVLLLFPDASVFFILLLVYSIISYWFLLIRPTQYARSFLIRMGIYTGVVLAVQYSIALFLYSFDSAFTTTAVLISISPVVLSWLYRQACRKWDEHFIKMMTIVLGAIALLIAVIVTIGIFPFWILIGLVMAGPFWSFLLALRAALWLYKNYETKLSIPRGLGFTAWLAAYIAAWRYDILKMYELYAALPPQPPPDCYIATAAAQGHPQFVCSHTVHRVDGRSMQVNGQLQVLKFAELALLSVNPPLHIFLRRIYDVVGKFLARRIHNPFMADVAYLFLKPFEWLARWLLKVIIPEIDVLTEKIYTE